MNVFQTAAHFILLHVGSGLGGLFRKRCMARTKRGTAYSEKWLMKTLRASRNTEYGKKYGFADIRSVEDYRRLVPLSEYEDYRPYIMRTVKNGEQKLITGHKINFFAGTSGTVSEPKLIPQIKSSFLGYFKCICILANQLVQALRSRGVSSAMARGFLLTDIQNMEVSDVVEGGGEMPTGGISSYAANGVGTLLPIFTPTPGEVYGNKEISDVRYIKARYALQEPDLKWIGAPFMSAVSDIIQYIDDSHDLLIRDIEAGTIDPSVAITDNMRARLEKKLRPNPERAAELREIFSTPSDTPLASRLWKDLSFVASIGTADFLPFTRRMQAYCAKDVRFHYLMYAASEALMGFAMHLDDPRYLLLADGGFYEFMPIEEECEEMPERPLLMHELEVGKHYELILTNLSGFYRYRMHDVVRVKGYEGEVPYIEFAYRTAYLTDMCSLHLKSEFLTAAVEMTEAAAGVRIEDYSIYPDAERVPPRLELFMELERPVTAEELADMTRVFDESLRKVSLGYNHWRRDGVLDVTLLRPVPAETYLHYREMRIAQGASSNQFKAVRVIKDPQSYEYFSAAAKNGQEQMSHQ